MKTLLLTTLLLSAATLPNLRAHEGHDHGPVPGETVGALGPLTLSEATVKNLGLQTIDAEITELRSALTVPARLTVPPEKHARITAVVDGRVTRIAVRLGQVVKKGETLVEVSPLAIGTKPLEITSPLDGTVLNIPFALGQGFKPEDVLIEVADLSELLAEGSLFQTPELLQFSVGQPATMRLDSLPETKLEGKIDRIDPAANPETNTLRIYAAIANADGRLKVNLTGKLALGYGEAQTVLAVPARAVLGDLGNLFVFVEAKERTYERRAVTLGMRSGERVEILDGVVPGEKVVTLGNYQLQYMTATPAKKEMPKTEAKPAEKAAPPHDDGDGHEHAVPAKK